MSAYNNAIHSDGQDRAVCLFYQFLCLLAINKGPFPCPLVMADVSSIEHRLTDEHLEQRNRFNCIRS